MPTEPWAQPVPGRALVIEVRDDGRGMEPGVPARLLGEPAQANGLYRIGVANVHRRIRLNFGAPYGLCIDSEPGGPRVLYQLAASERTVAAVQPLKATGEAIDPLDNRKFNALAYALERRDLEAARRLLRLGARPDTLVGEADMPVALLPVISADLDAVRLMRQFKVDDSKLRFQGSTAIDHAKRMGDRRLLEALGRETGAL